MKRAALALAALASVTVALAQQTASPTTAEPRTSTAPSEPSAPPAGSRLRLSEADKQTLSRDCLRQVQADNPNVPEKDVKAYCDQAVKSYATQR
jgi:hypothetical protein